MAEIPLQIAQRRLDTGNVVQYPQGGEIGRAMQSAGSEFTQIADYAQQRQDRMDRFKLGIVEDARDQDYANQAAEAARNGSADGAGLHDALAGQIDQATGNVIKPGLFDAVSDKYREQVPASQRGFYDASLASKRLAASGAAASAQYEQEQKYATVEVGKIQNGIIADILRMNDPAGDAAGFDALKAKGRQAILNAPLGALAKQSMLNDWDQSSPKALAQAISAQNPGKLRELFGMSAPADTNLPAGMRNNNPGNIKFVSRDQAAGVIGPSSNLDQGDPQAVFNTPQAGMRAAYELALKKYAGGKTTANQLIASNGGWTPGNTQAAANIAATMGIGPDDNLNLRDPAQAKSFLRALVTQEHGPASKAYSDQMIADAVDGKPLPAAAPRHTGPDLPVVFGNTAGRVSATPDMSHINPDMMARFRNLQNVFGSSLPIVSGYRDADRNERAGGAKASQHLHGDAFDIDVRDMSQEERVRLIQTARAQGFGGIGVYANSIHIDIGPVRAWGASHHGDSLPVWARKALDEAPGAQLAEASRTGTSAPDPRFVGMSPDDMVALANNDDVALKQKQAADVAQAKIDYTAKKDHIELGIRTGEIRDPAMVLNSGLNEGDQATLYEMLKTENKDNAGVDAILGAIAADKKVSINPFNSDMTKVADKAYNQFIQKVPDDQRLRGAATYVTSTGYIPDALQAELRQGAAAKTAPELSVALSNADTLERMAPTAFTTIPGSDVQTKLADYRHYVNDLGMTGDAAAQQIIDHSQPATKQVREELKPQADKFLKNLTVGDVTNAFDTFTGPGGEPGAGAMPQEPAALLAEYKSLAEDAYYDTGGNADLAKARALQAIKKNWGISNISGTANLMRLPPENQYPPIGGSFDYLRADALKTAQDYVTAQHPDRKVENVAIRVSDKWTRRDIEMKRPARYELYYQYEDHGQPVWDQAFGVPWGVSPEEIDKVREEEVGRKMISEAQAARIDGDILRRAQNQAKQIATDPDPKESFIRALDVQNTLGAAQTQVENRKAERARANEPAPSPEEQAARARGTRSFDGSQPTGFGNIPPNLPKR